MKNLLLILSILIFISSCATIMTGKTQEITFDSEPQGAEVAVNELLEKHLQQFNSIRKKIKRFLLN